MRRLLPDISPLVNNEPDCILVSRVLEGVGCSYILHDYLLVPLEDTVGTISLMASATINP